MVNDAEKLRSPNRMFDPDPRTTGFVKIDVNNQVKGPIEIIDQFEAITSYRLNLTVPEAIQIHFETAKNLYLYAWCVYRFYPVAEQQVLSTLEFALRERMPEFVEKYVKKHPRNFEPGLRVLLDHSIKIGLVRNDDFPGRERWALKRARERYRFELFDKMHREGLTEIIFDDSLVVASEEDINHDWLGVFQSAIPYIRNKYAHGSGMLYHSVLHSFDVVSQIINQLYPGSTEEDKKLAPVPQDF